MTGRFMSLRNRANGSLVYAAALLASGQFVLSGQFADLATNGDGTTLYFASSTRPKASTLSLHSKIYRWSARDGVLLFAEQPTEDFDGCAYRCFFELRAPQVSADGAVVAYTGARPQSTNRFCPAVEPNQATVLAGGESLNLPGGVALSRNGRYAVTAPADGAANRYHVITDLATGRSVLADGAFNGWALRVTDTGAVISPQTTAILLTERDGRTRVIRTAQAVDNAAIDRMGRTIVYTTRFGRSNPGRIAALDVKSGSETELDTGLSPAIAGVSGDGATVYYLDDKGSGGLQLFAVSATGGGARQVTRIRGGVSGVAVSDDGRSAFLTVENGLLRIDIPSGEATQILPPTPLITAAYRGGLPPQTTIAPAGAVMALWGAGLHQAVDATFCGVAVGLLDAPAGAMPSARFRIPWDVAEGPCLAVMRTASPLESTIRLDVRKYDPQFIHDDTLYLLYHEKFAGIVAAGAPSRPDEVISFYMTGLGPADAEGRVGAGFSCAVDSVPADLTYAGVAPGVEGFYQVNLRVPSISAGAATLACGFGAERQAVAPLWVR
jgi:uncharacterized protein (TIGR03437 family)